MCKLRLSLIEEPTTYIYEFLFIIGALVAFIGNVFALYILWMPGHRTKSNKILTSLAISDTLTGLVVFPLSAYQILNESAKLNCSIDFMRAYLALLCAGSSVLTLVAISFDRYILLTKLASYDKIMSRRNIVILLLFCWLFPALSPLLKKVGPQPYIAILIIIFYGPIVLLIVFYCLLIKVIYISSNKILAHASPTVTRHQQKNIMVPCTSYASPSTDKKQRTGDIVPATIVQQLKEKQSEKRHLKIAKSVAVLLGCYMLFLTPFNIWLVLDLTGSDTTLMSQKQIQQLYLFGAFAGLANSCINPFIYLSKQPGFRKRCRDVAKKITVHELKR